MSKNLWYSILICVTLVGATASFGRNWWMWGINILIGVYAAMSRILDKAK